jgi:hypothetical protein
MFTVKLLDSIGSVKAKVNQACADHLNNSIQGLGISVYIQPSSFQNILSLGSGHVVYAKGDLHWLDWLIRMGDTIIVADYDYNPNTGRGRSGLGNMKKGGSFRVPPEFSGTLENNFITRALIGSEQEEIIAKIFKEVLA